MNLFRALETWDLIVLGFGLFASSPMDRSDGSRLPQALEPWKKKGRDYLNIEGIALSQLPSVVSLDILNLLRVFIPSSCHETLHQCFQI